MRQTEVDIAIEKSYFNFSKMYTLSYMIDMISVSKLSLICHYNQGINMEIPGNVTESGKPVLFRSNA